MRREKGRGEERERDGLVLVGDHFLFYFLFPLIHKLDLYLTDGKWWKKIIIKKKRRRRIN